jgi:multidrug efflux pump subunit AcrB
MRLSHFFIDRPIFAAVISIVIVILGGVSFFRLPIAQYPEIAPPVINVTGQYPGASAETVASTVVTPIEEQINGVENMLYMSSNSTSDGPSASRSRSTSAPISILRRSRSRTEPRSLSRDCRSTCAISASR